MSSERDKGFGGKGCLGEAGRSRRKAEEASGNPLPHSALHPYSAPPSCSNLGWLSYGVLKGDGTLIVVNAVGAVLQTLYIVAYLHYSPQKVEALLSTHLSCTPCFAGRANIAS